VARFLANVAGPAGTLLVLDDLQWAGADALDLLAALVGSAAEVPVRVVGAYRTTEVQPDDPLALLLLDHARADLLSHQPLTALPSAEAARLLDALLDESEDAGSVRREQILRRAGGVPFYLVSYARGLRTGAPPAEVPWDVGQSIRQRVAVLPEGARAVLGLAAVAGRQTGGALLVATATVPEAEVLAALDLACRADLLEDAGAAGYRFEHDVIREVVEADLGTARRAALHRRIAESLEVQSGERPIELLAYHYARSSVPEQAVPYLERTGDHARAQHANAAAAGHYQELVELLEGAGRALEAAAAREKWGAVLVTMARYDAALAVLERAGDT
jgi:predicted ATPase